MKDFVEKEVKQEEEGNTEDKIYMKGQNEYINREWKDLERSLWKLFDAWVTRSRHIDGYVDRIKPHINELIEYQLITL